MGARDLSSGSHAWVTGTLSTEAPLPPNFEFLLQLSHFWAPGFISWRLVPQSGNAEVVGTSRDGA